MKRDYEFGGPVGAFFIIIFSHFLVYYLWASLEFYNGALVAPSSQMLHLAIVGAKPTLFATAIYSGFILFQFALARFVPGLWVKGLPIPSEGNRQLNYLCNGIGAWYITLAAAFILNITGIFPLKTLAENMGPMITVGMIWANVLAVTLLIIGYRKREGDNPPLYDFFMGAILNPRVGKVDLKLFSEIRVPWILLFFLTLSAAFKQYDLNGEISWPMFLMILAHGLYTNACMKGEECIPTTWDIFYEKFGWMLIFWNYVGVPFVYCFQSFYILKNNPELSAPFIVFLFALLIFAYYVWDTANSQKNRFRMQRRGTFVERKTFPQLPWGTLKNPKFIETASGDQLLIDGWYRYGRKIHYAADTVMAITWGMSCGFTGALPFLYPLFFLSMIIHRHTRDMKRCAKKYGPDWDTYCKAVPYKFIPYIY